MIFDAVVFAAIYFLEIASKRLSLIIKTYIFAACKKDRLAQLVEQRPFKAWALGSSPRPVTRYGEFTRKSRLSFTLWYFRT